MAKINSLTPKSILAGTKNSHSEGFWLAKHKHTNTHTMMEPFPPPAAWFCWPTSIIPHPREPLRKELGKAAVEGFYSPNQYNTGENNLFLLPLYQLQLSRPPSAMIAKVAFIAVGGLP